MDVDVDQAEVVSFAEKVYYSYCVKTQNNEKRRRWALNGVLSILKVLLKKRKQTRQNVARYNLYVWKIQAMKKESELDMAQRNVVLKSNYEFW